MIDFLDLAYYTTIFLVPIVIYSTFFKNPGKFTKNNPKDWFYLLKLYVARKAVKQYQLKNRKSLQSQTIESIENVKEIQSDKYQDNHFIYGADQKGNYLSLRLIIKSELLSETFLSLGISGKNYKIPKKSLKVSRISKWSWKNQNLHIEILEPLKKLRITYNGLLTSDEKLNQHVKFNYIWTSASGATFHPQDSSTQSLARALANEKWRDGDWISQLGDERGYDQFGTLNGTITIANRENQLSILPSVRTRSWGTSVKFTTARCLHVFVASADGTLVDLWLKKLKNGCTRLVKGSVISDSAVKVIDQLHVDLDHLVTNLPEMITIEIGAGTNEYRCVCHLKRHEQVTVASSCGYLINVPAECDFDCLQARAIVEFWYDTKCQTSQLPPPLLQETAIDNIDTSQNCVNIKDGDARNVKLTGGKGCSLALMSTIQSSDFDIPDAFIVTTTCFQRHFERNVNLTKAVKHLDNICCGRTQGNLEDACAHTSQAIKREPIDAMVTEQVLHHLKQLRATDVDVKFAVRSSGVDEDGDDLSAAGQNDTYLGLASDSDVIEAITSCWASLYTLTSVKYRHQHGVGVRTKMAVVVQKMVDADSAGVLFTCHPFSANPGEIVITSNFGLGETVVSGHTDPDTITLTRGCDNSLKIQTKSVGRKNKILKMSQVTGVETSNSNDSDNDSLSLTDEQILTLARIGLDVEEKFGNFRDIEWAIQGGRIHLLQSRPITTANAWTEYELTHEFDSPVLGDQGIFTVANTGEVFPGATSILTLTTFVMSLDRALQMGMHATKDDGRLQCTKIFHNHLFLDVINSIHINPQREINMAAKILDLAIFGHPVIDEKIHRAALQRWGIKTKFGLIKDMAYLMKTAWNCDKSVKTIVENARTVNIDIDDSSNDSPTQMYEKIDKFLNVIPGKVCVYHCHSSMTSVFYQMIALNVLAGQTKEFTVDHYHDIALLLTSCQDVISAEIPKTLERIAEILRAAGKSDDFCQIPADNGENYLADNCPDAYAIYREFLQVHGHRVVGEFDLINDPWGLQPTKVIKMIQANAKTSTKCQKPKTKSVAEVIDSLKSPSNDITKKILKFLMSRARRAVANRERTKCEMVRSVHELRLAYRTLARKLVSEGLLPHERLIHHLSHYEVKQVIKRDPQSPTLITKASRRMRLWDKWDKAKFPEISYGFPQPEEDCESHFDHSGESIKCEGTPVCSGTVQARACVITTLDEIDQLKNGDILITYCTDIGWSPYFPMLSGIVTELGGLVSHGAVVAREYGLPSIVGVQRATKTFKTGDLVQLSGTEGLITLISR